MLRAVLLVAVLNRKAAAGIDNNDGDANRALPALSSTWSSVAIGGGGYVTGLVQSDNAAYARCDVGGAYLLPFKNGTRTPGANGSWRSLLDWVPPSLSNYYSVESMAAVSTSTRQSDDVIWMAVGDGFRMPSAILKSVDGGRTFSNQSYVVPMAGNGNIRWCGERLAIMAGTHGQTALFASRSHGVLKTANGSKWAAVALPVLADPGYSFLLATPGGLLLAGAYGVGTYVSADAGETWTLRKGPTFPCRAVYRPQTHDVVVTSNATGGGVDSVGGVAALALADSMVLGQEDGWSDLTPVPNQSYTGVAIDGSGSLYVSTHTSGYHNQIFAANASAAARGAWRLINNASAVERRGSVPWWGPMKFSSADSALLVVNDELLLTATWYGVWLASKSEGFSSWTTHEQGHEEVVVLEVVAPPDGEADLFTGVADVEGFRHTDLQVYPAHRLSNGTVDATQSTSGIDVCPSNASVVVRVHGNQGFDVGAAGAISHDNGVTWRSFGGFAPGRPGHLAATLGRQVQFGGGGGDGGGCDRLIYIPLDSTPYVSTDGGQSWTASSGAPNGTTGSRTHWEGCGCRRWACDRVRAECYVYSAGAANGTLSVSEDGRSWANSSAWLPAPHVGEAGYVATNFAAGGHVCLCLGGSGLWCSTDAGVSVAQVDGISSCRLVDWGAPAPGESAEATMFVFGRRTQAEPDEALHAQVAGAWVRVNPETHRLGRTAKGGPLAVSKKQWGEVFLGTDGVGVLRGVISIDPAAKTAT